MDATQELHSVTILINNVLNYINNITDNNQMMSAAICVWVMGCATYILRNIPSKIFAFMKKHMTTELTMTSYNSSFHELQKWLEMKGYSNKCRNIKITNGHWGDTSAVKTIGYGTHLIFFNRTPLLIEFIREENSNSHNDKEVINIKKIGRSHAVFDELIEYIRNQEDESELTNTKIYSWDTDDWNYVGCNPKRTFESVYISDEILDFIKTSLDNFIASEKWYIKHGIPYHLGILLHGPPGTGKTSVIKAIASYLNKPLCLCSTTALPIFSKVLSEAEKDAIVAVEDIDVSPVVHSRNISEDEEDESDTQQNVIGSSNLSNVLNAMDGVITQHGRIIIMTTNNVNILDSALLRPGRIDINIRIGYMDINIFKKFIDTFYPENMINFDDWILIDDKLSGAKLQQDILNKLKLEDIVKKYLKPKD